MMKSPNSKLTAFTAWMAHINLLGLSIWCWIQAYNGHLEWVLAFMLTGPAVISFPLLPNAGWNPIKKLDLCKNAWTWFVTLAIHLLSAAAFWSSALGRENFEGPYAVVAIITGLMLVRAHAVRAD